MCANNFIHQTDALTASSSSSELKILSRSLKDTAKSFSWMRLVEAEGLLPDGP